jgi:hypothetical protein
MTVPVGLKYQFAAKVPSGAPSWSIHNRAATCRCERQGEMQTTTPLK